MEKEFPFPCLRTRFKPVVPDPIVKYVFTDDSTGNESIKELPSSLFYHEFPLMQDEIKLQDYLDAGIPLREVPVRLYSSNDETDYPFTQQELYNRVENILNDYRKPESMED